MVVRNVRIEKRLGRRAGERIDGLVVVARHDEVLRAIAPLPDQRQLHPVEVLRLVRENHGRGLRRGVNVAQARVDQVGEIEQAVFPLVLGPLFFKLDHRRRPEIPDDHCAAEPAQLLKQLVAVFFGGIFLDCRLLAIELPLLLHRRDLDVRMVPVPFIDLRLRDLRPAERVPAVRVQGADAISRDGQIAARQFRGGGAREGGDQHALRPVPIHGAPDLPGDVGGFASPQLRGAEDAEFPRFFSPRLLLRNLWDAVGKFERITHRASCNCRNHESSRARSATEALRGCPRRYASYRRRRGARLLAAVEVCRGVFRP